MKLATILACLCLAGTAASATPRRTTRVSPAEALRQLDAATVRGVETDICYPASAEEYVALGRNAILMLRSSSALSTELPLQSAYVLQRGVRIPLHRVALLDKETDAASGRTIQVSFYLLPIQLMKSDARLLVDFSGQRTGFGVTEFSARRGLGTGAPAFARLDEYDTPTDPDPAVVARVLAREYPQYIH